MNSIRVFLCAAFAAGFGSMGFGGSIDWNFQDGSLTEGNYTGGAAAGQNNQPVGRIRFTPQAVGASLGTLTVATSGTRTGLSNFKVWISEDGVFDGGPTDNLFSTSAGDPGTGATGYSGSYTPTTTNPFYVFLTVDASSIATGTIFPVVTLAQGSQLANLVGSSGFDPMVNGDVTIVPAAGVKEWAIY